MLKTLSQELQQEGLLAQGDRVVVGVSGGADSMALLHLLDQLRNEHDWDLKLHIAHLNHQLRGAESEKDAAFIQAAADSLSIPCTIETVDVASESKSASQGVEEFGRNVRYAFFERVCLQTGSRIVAVAHHSDDNAETILQRVMRGTGVRGLVGIRRRRRLSSGSEIQLIRPLLRFTKKDIVTYLADAGLAYREDRSNETVEPMRNRVRHTLLPQIESDFNPQVRDALNRLGEQASWVEEYLRETVERTFESLIISRTDQELALNADTLARKSRIVQTEIVRLAFRSFGLGEQDLGFVHMVAAIDLIGGTGSGKHVQLPGGMTMSKKYHQLVFSLPTEEPRESIAPEIAVHLPGCTLLPNRRLRIDCEIGDSQPEDIPKLRHSGDPLVEYIDFDAVRPPLVVRKRRSGDRFCPLGAPGSKTLSDFLSDAKVDPKARDRVAVLCDHLGPIWIIGHRIDDRVKMTELTRRVLHLRASPLSP